MSTSLSLDLSAFLKSNNVWHNLIEKQTTVHTADAAAATGIPLKRITKSLVFLADGEPVIIIVPGNCRVNKDKAKELLGAKKLRIVPFEEAEKYSGYPAGGTPPVGYKKVSRVVMDSKVMQYKTVFGGGGTKRKLLEIKPSDVKRLNKATVADVADER